MKKVLATLAVLAVCSFGSMAFAAHEVGNVDQQPVMGGMLDVYGVAKVSVDLLTTGSNTTGTRDGATRVSSNSSRIGFKGAESVGADLWATYQLELGYNIDDAGGAVVLRNSAVGLFSKSFGTLLIGNWDTPYKMSTGKLDAFGDTMGDYNAIIGNLNGTTSYDLRVDNAIAYISPTFAGVHLMAATTEQGTEATAAATKSSKANSFALVYSAGPLYATAALETHDAGIDSATSSSGTKIGVGYDLKASGTKIGLVYEMLSNDADKSAATRNAMYLAVSQKVGNEVIKLAYGSADDGESAADTGATMMAIGVDHALSKRTSAYLVYAATTNEKGATYGLGQSGAGGNYKPAADEDPSVISIGINHSF